MRRPAAPLPTPGWTKMLPQCIALIALLAAAGLFAARPAGAQTTDYDANDNGLIEIRNLAQLDAMRYDLNGNGDATQAEYADAFPNRETAAAGRMGCPQGKCAGYELTASLTFPAAAGDYHPWTPILGLFHTTFDGNGHTLANLSVNVSSSYAGLFQELGGNGVIRNVGLINPAVRSTSGQDTGALVGRGYAGSLVAASYVQGGSVTVAATGTNGGGLMGYTRGAIRASYATARVVMDGARGGVYLGGLVGWLRGGAITASYAAGAVSGAGGSNTYIGGLAGVVSHRAADIADSYCDLEATGQSVCVQSQFTDASVTSPGYDTADLQRPTGYTGIYRNWNLDTDGDSTPDDPWHFGSSNDYPTLRYSRPPGAVAGGGPGGDASSQDTPYNPALDHPESYVNDRYAMAATCAVSPGADGETESALITFDLGQYQGDLFLSLSLWNGEHFASYESHDLDPPPLEREGQSASVRVTTDPAQTRFLLDGKPNGLRLNLLLGYADCHTDDAAAPADAAATSTAAAAAPKPYVNDRYAMTATCAVQPNAGGDPASALIRFDLGDYQGDVYLSLSLWNGEYYASYESHGLDPPLLEREGQSGSVRVTTNPAETRFLLDGTPNGLRMNLLLGYADCHTAGE